MSPPAFFRLRSTVASSSRLPLSRPFTASASIRKQQSVCEQLKDIKDLAERASAVNSKAAKAEIISSYPHLRDVLEHVYDSTLRLHTTSKSIDNASEFMNGEPSPYPSISALFDALSAREVTGNKAKEALANFISFHDIAGDAELMTVFRKLVDRNLTAGFGANTLKDVDWAATASVTSKALARPAQTVKTAAAPKTSPAGAAKTSSTPQRSLTKLSPALGKTVLKEEFSKLFKGNGDWYASRKLDGVRCVMVVDLKDDGGSVVVTNIAPLSRAGNQFTSLARVEEEVRAYLPGFLQESKWLKDSAFNSEDGKQLVIDGEVCVMRPRRDDEKVHLPAASTSASTIDGDDNLIEDFASTVGLIKRKDSPIPHPVFFVLDIIPGQVFDNTGPTTFSERIEHGKELVAYFNAQAQHDGKQQVLRKLDQWKVRDIPQLEAMVERAATEGWEGLVIRKDAPYEGKRTSNIRKFKQWQEAEYTVVDMDCSTMRLAVDGVFEDRLACSNVWIEHKGTRVSVGSGFDAEQRLRYAADPSEIVGKQITLEYFSESTSVGRGGEAGGASLRFPRVKTVWEDGKRDI